MIINYVIINLSQFVGYFFLKFAILFFNFIKVKLN